jgi:2-isopropylmalate synthase
MRAMRASESTSESTNSSANGSTNGSTSEREVFGGAPRYRDFAVRTIVDETLREGLERCMFPVPVDDLYRLFRAQHDAGIRETIVGAGPGETALLERICADQDRGVLGADVRPIFLVMLNCWESAYHNLARLPRAWLERTTLSFGMVELGAEERLLERVFDKLEALGARRFKSSVLNDFTRGCREESYERIAAQLERAGRLGIRAFRINDSVGKLYPEDAAELCGRLCADFPQLALCLHCHDDRGLALANQLASIYHGFQAVEGSLCGLGNRSGITALEALVSACRDRGIRLGEVPLDLGRLCANARLAEAVFLAVPSTYRPVSGRFAGKTNFGVMNIPDFLRAGGERDYFLSAVNLHRETIARALVTHGFAAHELDDDLLDGTLADVRALIGTRHAGARGRYDALVGAIDALYEGSQLSVADIAELARARRRRAG